MPPRPPAGGWPDAWCAARGAGKSLPEVAGGQHRCAAGIPSPMDAGHQSEGPLAVFYDGACVVCSSEMEGYRRRDRERRLALVDIAAPGFDAHAWGLDPAAVQRAMHVRLPSGEVRTGVAAFVEVWRRLPGFALAARVAASPVLRPILAVGYWIFARLVRPLLPRRRRGCESGACQPGRRAGE